MANVRPWAIFVLTLGWFAALSATGCRKAPDDQSNVALAEAKKEGLPTTERELEALNPIPDAENALGLLKSLELVPPRGPQTYDLANATDRRLLGSALTRYRTYFDVSRQLLRFKKFRTVNSDFASPAFNSARSLVKVLTVGARLDFASGNSKAGFERLGQAAHLESLIMQNASLIQVLVAVGIESATERELLIGLSTAGSDASSGAAEDARIVESFRPPDPIRSIVGVELVEAIEVGFRDAQFLQYIDYMGNLVTADTPYDLALLTKILAAEKDWEKNHAEAAKNFDLASTYGALVDAVLRLRVRALMNKAIAAAVAYRAKNGRFPTTIPLTKLEVSDPTTGRTILYRLRPKGFVVYCIGPDGRDHGGKLAGNGTVKTGYDEGYAFPTPLGQVVFDAPH